MNVANLVVGAFVGKVFWGRNYRTGFAVYIGDLKIDRMGEVVGILV